MGPPAAVLHPPCPWLPPLPCGTRALSRCPDKLAPAFPGPTVQVCVSTCTTTPCLHPLPPQRAGPWRHRPTSSPPTLKEITACRHTRHCRPGTTLCRPTACQHSVKERGRGGSPHAGPRVPSHGGHPVPGALGSLLGSLCTFQSPSGSTLSRWLGPDPSALASATRHPSHHISLQAPAPRVPIPGWM